MQNKAVFLDRDGVINKPVLRNGRIFSPRNIRELKFFPNIGRSIKKIKNMGFMVIVFTNQPDIARGISKREDIEEINNFIKEKFKIHDIFMCPHDDSDNCDCRKPKPGMLIRAKDKWDIKMDSSFVIGDSWRDISAGNTAGVKTLFICREKNRENIDINPDWYAEDLYSAVKIIYSLTKKTGGEYENIY